MQAARTVLYRPTFLCSDYVHVGSGKRFKRERSGQNPGVMTRVGACSTTPASRCVLP